MSKLHAQERESEKLQRFFENVDSGVDSGVRAMMDGREHRSRADLGKDTCVAELLQRHAQGAAGRDARATASCVEYVEKELSRQRAREYFRCHGEEIGWRADERFFTARPPPTRRSSRRRPAKSPHADKRQEGRNFINDGVSDDEVLKTFMEGGTLEPVRAAVKENKSSPTPSPSPSPFAFTRPSSRRNPRC